MKEKHFHILNGDALKAQFPKELSGEIIVARECLVDGPVEEKEPGTFFKNRAKFIAGLTPEITTEDYLNSTVSEFDKIRAIPENSLVNLWFEDDLFCQVNFWFVAHLLQQSTANCKVFLVRPKVHTPFGFGGLNKMELQQVYEEKTEINKLHEIAALWEFYRNNDTIGLTSVAKKLSSSYPFIFEAAKAHVDRIPTKNNPGRPVQSLIEIMEELQTEEFIPVFREFSKREAIYGFGDLQVKRLLEEIKNMPNNLI